MLADRYRTAFKRCRLATLSDATLDKLTHGSTFLDVPADGTVMRFGSTEAYVAVVIDGFGLKRKRASVGVGPVVDGCEQVSR
jgi:uncharacterized membrane-anchored protein